MFATTQYYHAALIVKNYQDNCIKKRLLFRINIGNADWENTSVPNYYNYVDHWTACLQQEHYCQRFCQKQ